MSINFKIICDENLIYNSDGSAVKHPHTAINRSKLLFLAVRISILLMTEEFARLPRICNKSPYQKITSRYANRSLCHLLPSSELHDNDLVRFHVMVNHG